MVSVPKKASPFENDHNVTFSSAKKVIIMSLIIKHN